jgi:hypothetical protein
MKSIIDKMRRTHQYVRHYAQFPELFTGIIHFANGNESRKKSRFAILVDILYCFFVLKMMPRNYYLFGFHTKDRREFKNYMDETDSPLLKRRLYESLWDVKYTSLVNDKYIFHCLCMYNQFPVPEIYGTYVDGTIKPGGRRLDELMFARGLDKVILKPLMGLQGKGIYFASRGVEGIEMRSASSGEVPDPGPQGQFIVQEIIGQHPEMDRINPFCLNSIRIITLLTYDDGVQVLAAMLRTNAGKVPLDNFSLGGIVVGIDLKDGRLKKFGFMKDTGISSVTRHPLTGLVFEGFTIPYWNEIKQTVIRAQRFFNVLKGIGWDVAVGPQGPVMIEGNVEWGTTGIQAASGGLLTPDNRAAFACHGLIFYGREREMQCRLVPPLRAKESVPRKNAAEADMNNAGRDRRGQEVHIWRR